MDESAVLSEAEQQFMRKTLFHNQIYRRLDGRSSMEFRPIRIETSPPSSNNRGSARIVAGCTEILCNVQLYTWKPETAAPADGVFDFIVSVDETLAQAREHSDDTERDEQALSEQLRMQLLSAYKNSYDLPSLSIVSGHYCWKIVVLVYVTCGDGNLLDLTSICAYAALSQLTIPHCEVIKEEIEEGKFEYDLELVDDVNTWHRLNMQRIPLITSVYYMAGGNPPLLVDATREEETIMDGRIITAFLRDGKCTMVRSLVNVLISEQSFKVAVIAAEQLAASLFKELTRK